MEINLVGKAVKRILLPTVDYNASPVVVIPAQQNDVQTRYVEVALFDDRGVIDLTPYSGAILNATLPDQTPMFINCDVIKADSATDGTRKNTVLVGIGSSLLAAEGRVPCEVSVFDEGKTMWLTSKTFYVVVYKSQASNEAVEATPEYNSLQEMLKELEESENARVKAEEERQAAEAEREKKTGEALDRAEELVTKYDTDKEAVERGLAMLEEYNMTAAEDAARAETAMTAAESAAERAEAAQDAMQENFASIEAKLLTKADNLFFDTEDGKLYLLSEGEKIGDGVTVATSGGGGGGGSSNNAILTLQSTTGWLTKSIAENQECLITGIWSSLEGDLPTGAGTLTVTVGGIVKRTTNIEQGPFSISVGEYLTTGTNSIRISVTDVYNNKRTISYTVTVVALSLSSTFNANRAYSDAINYTYVPRGNVSKIVHFIIDGEEEGTETVLVSGRQQTYIIEKQTHGSHTFEVYFTAMVDGQDVESNHLYYDLICTEAGNNTPIIASSFNREELEQFETVNIPYIVYNPASVSSTVTLSVNGRVVSTLTVGRTEQIWTYRADTSGEVQLEIACGEAKKTFTVNVAGSSIDVEAETRDLDLYLTSTGRSNSELEPAKWEFNDIACTFAGYNWVNDGWQIDARGIPVHRVTGNARLTIPLKVFENDFRITGKTIEIEFATRDVLDYDAVVMSCFSGNRGFEITAQEALLKSEMSEISTQYKEDEHIRLSFVVEKAAENRLIYIYLNGIMCGAARYSENDDFSQGVPVNITVGSNDCTIDIYNIRVYSNDLTRYQILDNWIADTQDVEERLARYNRNAVYDDYGSIVADKLPTNIPYLILQAETLPQYKGNKVDVDGSYTDKNDSAKSFEFEGASADVQGTSSAGYARKNYKIKFKGFKHNDVDQETYQLRANSIPTKTFTFKADVASSEGANNVELVRLYNETCPYKTPPQEENPNVRQGIDGLPIVIFHNDGQTTTFLGKYNFNNDKGTPEVYGFTEGDESWEILNNTSNRTLFKSADFDATDENGEKLWKEDFEARYPEYEDEQEPDISNLQPFVAWVASTDQTAATNAPLPEAKTWGGVKYESDTKEYRLAKFKNEFSEHAELQSAIYYYLFTELFLMVDSRAKNAFPSKFGSGKVCWLPYDMDTAIGINNEGSLVFGYELEDIDKVDEADVYNGQQSVFWINLREAFGNEIRSMYQELRSQNKLSYEIVEKAFEEHQAVWSEAIWNEDAYYKYLQPLLEEGADYLQMLQGSKSEQRKWWLYNRFRYIDSKYNAGDAQSDMIVLRGYAKSNISIEPYADIYASILFGSYLRQVRALRGKSYEIECPVDNLNDTEIHIYSASQIKSTGDLSGLKVGRADFSKATKLQYLKLGDAAEGYTNPNLTTLTLGNNVLLKTLDLRNCINLASEVNVSASPNIEEIYLEGTKISGVVLPNGGILKTLHLPETVTSIKLLNQTALTDFSMPSYEHVTSFWIENSGVAVDSANIVKDLDEGSRVRLIGVNWNFQDTKALMEVFDALDTMRGIDESGGNTQNAQVTGNVNIVNVRYSEFERLQSEYPDINFTYENLLYKVEYKNKDGSILYTAELVGGANAEDPVEQGYISEPKMDDAEDTKYSYRGWDKLPTNVQKDEVVTAQYDETYAVFFYNDTVLLYTTWVENGGRATFSGEDPTKDQTPQYKYSFSGWATINGAPASPAVLDKITGPLTVYAAFIATIRQYTVQFYNGDSFIESVVVDYGADAECSQTPEPSQEGDRFSGWIPSNKNIQEDTTCRATFTNPNVLNSTAWSVISEISEKGQGANYFSVGDCKEVTLNGTIGTLELLEQKLYVYILGFDHNERYEGKGIHFGTFKSAQIDGESLCLTDSHYSNYTSNGSKWFNMNHSSNTNVGGWQGCDLRYDILGSVHEKGAQNAAETTATSPVENTLMAALPFDLRQVMKPMTKFTDNYGNSSNTEDHVTETTDYLPLLAEYEIFGSRSYANNYERNRQAQYAYYAAGNTKIKKRFNGTIGDAANWWERSASFNSSGSFCRVANDGYAGSAAAAYSFGVAPAFKV